MLRIELLVDARNELGEGPLWDVQEQRLYWIDSHGRLIQRCDARGQGLERWCVPEHIGSMCLREQGGAVVSLRNGFHLFDFATGACTAISDPEARILRTRLNDGKVDRQGRFIAGYMDYEEKDPLGGLYRLDPDLAVTKLDEGIIVSNGPCFSLDGATLYFADSWTRCIFAYGYDTATGAVVSRRSSQASSRPDCAAIRTVRPSMPRASSGAPRSMAAGSSASPRTARWTAWSACRSTASPA